MELASLLPTEEDLLYEEELLRSPYSLSVWTRYLAERKGVAASRRRVLWERAVAALPGSYKLWSAYLRERLEAARGVPGGLPASESLNNTFERALVTMHKMPRIWELYLRSLLDQKLLTKTRRACDRALAALPVTQHDRVWAIYLVRRHSRQSAVCAAFLFSLPSRSLSLAKTACPWRPLSGAPAPALPPSHESCSRATSPAECTGAT